MVSFIVDRSALDAFLTFDIDAFSCDILVFDRTIPYTFDS
jgi:hypothetical protein